MVLNKLKEIRDELKKSAKSYDEAFKNTSIVAAESLVAQKQLLEKELNQNGNDKILDKKDELTSLPSLSKQYFLKKYGSLNNTKRAYIKAYGKKKYGRSWDDFLEIAVNLPSIEKPELTLEARVSRIEKILTAMGYKL